MKNNIYSLLAVIILVSTLMVVIIVVVPVGFCSKFSCANTCAKNIVLMNKITLNNFIFGYCLCCKLLFNVFFCTFRFVSFSLLILQQYIKLAKVFPFFFQSFLLYSHAHAHRRHTQVDCDVYDVYGVRCSNKLNNNNK